MSILTEIKNAITKDKTKTISSKIKQIKGIDVSSYQGIINWNKVSKTDVKFVILRGTTKNGELDTKFWENFKGAKSIGLNDISVYHFSYALDVKKAISDAKNLINKLNGEKMVIWLDLEWVDQAKLGKNKITEIATAFINTCSDNGYICNIYSNLDWYKNYYDSDKLKKLGCKFWIARYGSNDGIINTKYKPNVGEYIWQYTSKGTVQGINGDVDMNMKYEVEENKTEEYSLQKLVRVICTSIYKRTSPNSSNSKNIAGTYKNNDIIEVIGITSNKYWYKDINGNYFTSNSKYVTDLVGIVDNCYKLNLRELNNTNGKIITELNKGDSLYLLKKTNNWYYVSTNKGINGWVNGNYVKLNT